MRNIELYLEAQGYNEKARALFYLGLLAKLCEKKTCMERSFWTTKINSFKELNGEDIPKIFRAAVERLVECGKLDEECESVMHGFAKYHKPQENYEHTEITFYLMSGYTYSATRFENIVPPIVGLAEAAEMLGWSKNQINIYRKRGKFPEPVAHLASGPIWKAKQIEEFKSERGLCRSRHQLKR